MLTERRNRPVDAPVRAWWRQGVRSLCWTLDLDDDYGDPSILKLMAVAFTAAAVHGAWKLNATLGIGMGFLATCTALGYKGAKLFAAWKGVNLEERRAVIEATVHTQESAHVFAVADPAAG